MHLFSVEDTMVPSQDEQEEQEQSDDGSNSSVLSKEIEPWSNFEYTKEENRLLFNKMLSECKENEDYTRAASSKDEFFSAKSLFMVLILQQQKMINELI
jgi:hypothetical protein